jgi:hypothetical protein
MYLGYTHVNTALVLTNVKEERFIVDTKLFAVRKLRLRLIA